MVAFIFFAMLPLNAITFDTQAKWSDLELGLPVSKKDIVISKYVLGFIGILIAFLLVFIIQMILNSQVNINILCYGVSCALFLLAIQIPITFKCGVAKGRMLTIVLVGALTSLFTIFMRMDGSTVVNLVMQNIPIVFVFAVISIVVSMQISTRIMYKN